MFELVKPEEQISNSGDGHNGIVLKSIVGEKTGSTVLSVNLVQVEPGGVLDAHRHPVSEHCYYVLEGEMLVVTDTARLLLKKGMAIWVGTNELHGIANESNETTTYLAITTPPTVHKTMPK